MTIKIKYHNKNIDKLEKIDQGDHIDLRAAKTIKLKKGDFTLIPLGVSMHLPEGYEAHIVPRSSTFKNFGILQTNSQGIIDELYCGDGDEWKMPVFATRDTTIPENARIAQFRIQRKQPSIQFVEVDSLGNEDRGGFGSTGIN